MVTEETLLMIQEAFNRLSQERNLQGWTLDNMGWSYQDPSTDDLTVHLLKEPANRRSIVVAPGKVLERKGTINVEGLMEEIERALIEKGLIEE